FSLLSIRKCLAVEETVVVVLAASAAMAVEDAECTLMWRRTQLQPSLMELHQQRRFLRVQR
ncbi:TPA: hypothetical protein ACF94O_004737, partial [Salmonella enterica subsp. enterica serovar Newport]